MLTFNLSFLEKISLCDLVCPLVEAVCYKKGVDILREKVLTDLGNSKKTNLKILYVLKRQKKQSVS